MKKKGLILTLAITSILCACSIKGQKISEEEFNEKYASIIEKLKENNSDPLADTKNFVYKVSNISDSVTTANDKATNSKNTDITTVQFDLEKSFKHSKQVVEQTTNGSGAKSSTKSVTEKWLYLDKKNNRFIDATMTSVTVDGKTTTERVYEVNTDLVSCTSQLETSSLLYKQEFNIYTFNSSIISDITKLALDALKLIGEVKTGDAEQGYYSANDKSLFAETITSYSVESKLLNVQKDVNVTISKEINNLVFNKRSEKTVTTYLTDVNENKTTSTVNITFEKDKVKYSYPNLKSYTLK